MDHILSALVGVVIGIVLGRIHAVVQSTRQHQADLDWDAGRIE